MSSPGGPTAANEKYLNTASFTEATQGKYVPISFIGFGATGFVWVALPKTLITHPVWPAQVPALRAQLCAVKVFKTDEDKTKEEDPYIAAIIKNFKIDVPSTVASSSLEIAALLQLRKQIAVKPRLAAHFPRVIETFTQTEAGPGKSAWLSMSLIRGFTLDRLFAFANTVNHCPLPETLIYHLFVQLGEALEFMHGCGISKSDIQAVNIMIDPTKSDVPGLPNFVFIDFGGSKVAIRDTKTAIDRSLFCGAMYDFATRNHICVSTCKSEKHDDRPEKLDITRLQRDICAGHDKNWKEFVDALKGGGLSVAAMCGKRTDENRELRPGGRLFEMAKSKRSLADEFNRKIIKVLIHHTFIDFDKIPTETEVLEAVVRGFEGRGQSIQK